MKRLKSYKLKITTLIILGVFCIYNMTAQTPTPVFQEFKPINTPHYTNSNLTNNQATTNQNTPLGATSEDVINQSYKVVQAPVYRAGMTQAEIQQANMNYIQQRMANDPAYQMPNAKNGFQNPTIQKEKEMTAVLNEVNEINTSIRNNGHYESENYKTDLQNYQNAFQKLKDMLEGKAPLSIADALYIEESAYGDLQLSYKEYKQNIAQSADFIKKWMLQNKLNPSNSEAVHLAIQKFMGDELSITILKPDQKNDGSLKQTHKPFMYDYIDYRGEKDLHNYFVTKTLATGTGQCNTLPRAYAVFAEAMGVEASITFVHQHSFIKYKNSKGTFENYETTIDWHMSDNDYMEDMPVMAEAIKNKIYLQPLSKKQMIASIIIDIAYNFHREHWTSDGTFINQCIDYGMTYFNGQAHREGLLLQNLVLASQLDRVLFKNNITDLKDIEKSPEAMKAYQFYRYSSDRLAKLGIQDFPESVYNAMLEKHDTRGKLQIAKNINTKVKKSLFSTIQTP